MSVLPAVAATDVDCPGPRESVLSSDTNAKTD